MVAIIVGIAGGTASGKTSLSRELVACGSTERAAVVELDSYYRCQAHKTFAERLATNYDHPDAFEFELLVKHLISLKEGRAVDSPVYNFAEHTRSTDRQTHVHPRPVIIVEGILALAVPALCELLDFRIFVDAPDDLRLSRRLDRDVRERGRAPEQVLSHWSTTVQPMYLQYCSPSRAGADLIFDGSAWHGEQVRDLWHSIWARIGHGEEQDRKHSVPS